MTSAQPSQAAPGPYGRQARGGRSAKDMALSMAVLLIPVFLFLVGYRVFFAGDAPIPVDAAQVYATAQHDAHFPILVPRDLPPDWTPIAAKFDPTGGAQAEPGFGGAEHPQQLPVGAAVLRVSYVTPARSGLQLVESDRPVDALLPDELGSDAQPGNLIDIAGRQWREYPVAKGGGRALVLAGDGDTTVITGTADDNDMRTFAAALH